TVFAVQSSAKFAAADGQVFLQLKEYAQIFLPLLVVLAVAIIQGWYSNHYVGMRQELIPKKNKWLNLLDFDKPLLGCNLNYIWFCCACSMIIFVLVLGKNRGNHLTYLFQLISPFMLVGIFALISKMPK